MKMSKIKLVKLPDHPEDLKYWNKRFSEDEPSQKELDHAGIIIEEIDMSAEQDASYLTMVKVGSQSYHPSPADLEEWRQVFENAKGNPDFKIFTHDAVEIQRVKLEEEKPTIILVGAYKIVGK